MKLQMICNVVSAAARPQRKSTPIAAATKTTEKMAQTIDEKTDMVLVCGRWKDQYAKPNEMEKQVSDAHSRQSGN